MVLHIPDGTALRADAHFVEQLVRCEQLRKAARDFLSRVGEVPLPATQRSACALMGEQALVRFRSGSEGAGGGADGRVTSDWHVGSTDATTCLIAVAVCRESGTAWAAHYNSSLAADDRTPLELLPCHMRRPDLYLTGSFVEPTGESSSTLRRVCRALHESPLPFTVRLACIDTLNTRYPHQQRQQQQQQQHPEGLASQDAQQTSPEDRGVWDGASVDGAEGHNGGAAWRGAGGPAAINLAVCCSSGRASPAGFADRGPELPRRFGHDHVSVSHERLLRHIVDTDTGRLVVPGLRCAPLHPAHAYAFRRLLALPDGQFLQRCSTSPEWEPPHFVEDIRAAYRWILELGEQGVEEVPDAVYEWEEGDGAGRGAGWRRVEAPREEAGVGSELRIGKGGWKGRDGEVALAGAAEPAVR